MLRQRIFPLLALLVILIIAACGGGSDDNASPSPTATGTPNPRACSANQAASLGDLTWEGIFREDLFETENWRVLKGQSPSPYVSVSRDLEVVGAIELRQTPLDSDFNAADGISALEAWARGFHAGAADAGEAAHGDNFAFTVRPVGDPVLIGSFCAIPYGFVGTSGGEEVDRIAGFATFDSENLYLIVATYDVTFEGEEGFHDPDVLAEFAPILPQFVETLTIPPE
ncbi:MAG: hypothetical protein IH957_08770 [Chloroflexi bacterium]|nr:hypothetical protein [Chloroflexota bacterium]